MFTIEPPPFSFMKGMACLMPQKTPWTFTETTELKTSIGISTMEIRFVIPALFTRTSSRPSAALISA